MPLLHLTGTTQHASTSKPRPFTFTSLPHSVTHESFHCWHRCFRAAQQAAASLTNTQGQLKTSIAEPGATLPWQSWPGLPRSPWVELQKWSWCSGCSWAKLPLESAEAKDIGGSKVIWQMRRSERWEAFFLYKAPFPYTLLASEKKMFLTHTFHTGSLGTPPAPKWGHFCHPSLL